MQHRENKNKLFKLNYPHLQMIDTLENTPTPEPPAVCPAQFTLVFTTVMRHTKPYSLGKWKIAK